VPETNNHCFTNEKIIRTSLNTVLFQIIRNLDCKREVGRFSMSTRRVTFSEHVSLSNSEGGVNFGKRS
jgi:hypothetical protein